MADATHAQIIERIEGLEEEVRELKEILSAWAAAKTAGGFLIWLGKVLLAVAALVVFARGGFSSLLGK